jgi:SAM-dependent methyltransferase
MQTNQAYADSDLQRIYAQRFSANLEYRKSVWRILIQDSFQKLIPKNSAILDLGCGYSEFINQVEASQKFGMDLNPDSPKFLAPGVKFLSQDCSKPSPMQSGTLDVVFTSNFFTLNWQCMFSLMELLSLCHLRTLLHFCREKTWPIT